MARKLTVTRGGLLAIAALAVGIWIGVTVGLATRARRGATPG
ncbi:MAG TPA: hypothetical protein VEL73_03265 [Mycobacteriales bacterium]|nr:hypothetical protein [Mycobacteriales bacterium]